MFTSLPRTRLRLKRTLAIALAWTVVGLFSLVFELQVMASAGVTVELWTAFERRMFTSLLTGLLGGGVYIFILRDRLRRFPYLRAIGISSALVLLVVVTVQALVPAYLSGGELQAAIAERLLSLELLSATLYWSLLLALTMLLVRLNDQYASGGLAYLTGKYRKPRQELRIFMFLDMRSSTAIAEQLGHVKFFQLLNELFTDITDPIIYSRGEIYQYVGDEVSVTWRLRRGIRAQNCLRCFFGIRRKLKARAAHYRKRYGIEPVFKAGFHYGTVTTGEVGLVKKETIFSGDVVNTAARIQNSCNAHGVDLLISKDLLDLLSLPEWHYTWREIGEIALKGKRREVSLWTVDERDGAPAMVEAVKEAAAGSAQ